MESVRQTLAVTTRSATTAHRHRPSLLLTASDQPRDGAGQGCRGRGLAARPGGKLRALRREARIQRSEANVGVGTRRGTMDRLR